MNKLIGTIVIDYLSLEDIVYTLTKNGYKLVVSKAGSKTYEVSIYKKEEEN